MVRMLSHKPIILFALLCAAGSLPRDNVPRPTPTVTRRQRPITASRLQATRVPGPLPTESEVRGDVSSRCRPDCQHTYCDEHEAMWCYVWGGVSAYDLSLGIIPGETRVYLGTCDGKPKTVAPKCCEGNCGHD
ncbi:hypothetical protein MAN_03414, partial [Metarhizium hybridum]